LDPRGDISFLNRKGQTLLGYDEKELFGKNWFETCVSERSRDSAFAEFRQAVTDNVDSAARFEYPIVARSGQEHVIAWRRRRLVNDAGQCIGVVGAGEDVTERRQAEKKAIFSCSIGPPPICAITRPSRKCWRMESLVTT
jgi:PAS domain S-box-containing protein